MTLTQKVLARADDERNMHACAIGHGFDSHRPLEHKIYEKGWMNAKSHLLPIIQELLELNEKMAEALSAISIKIVNPISMTDAKQLLASVEGRAEQALSEHSRVMKGLASDTA